MAANPKLSWLKGPTRFSASSSRPTASTSRPISKPGTPGPGTTKPGAGAAPSTYHNSIKDPSGRTTEYSSKDDRCPVCTTDRYLNPKLRLLVSPCYHKMCESCIDRLFTLGPAPCPICGKVLRKTGFVSQTFEDLEVEKEVSVRRRIAKEFNKKSEDFPDRKSFDDYLEEVEDITFNLINGIDLPATEARIASFRSLNAALIESNIQRDLSLAAELQAAEDLERAYRAEQARMAVREEADERAERARERRKVLEGLERGEDAEEVVRRTREEAERRARRAQALAAASAAAAAPPKQNRDALLSFAARSRAQAAPDTPHVAFLDTFSSADGKYTLLGTYDDPVSEDVRRDAVGRYRAGGYRIEEAWERAVRCAVIGLGCGVLHEEGDTPTPMEVDVGA